LVLNTSTDPTLVFQKAFWRRPDSHDKILHAERREWSEQGKGSKKVSSSKSKPAAGSPSKKSGAKKSKKK